jgi:acylphosphatase
MLLRRDATAVGAESDERLTAIVHGDVQGVGYRMFVLREAARLGLRGYVRNLPDGSVEAVAEGPRPLLEQFLAALRRGPRAADVTEVDVTWSPAVGAFTNFRVL